MAVIINFEAWKIAPAGADLATWSQCGPCAENGALAAEISCTVEALHAVLPDWQTSSPRGGNAIPFKTQPAPPTYDGTSEAYRQALIEESANKARAENDHQAFIVGLQKRRSEAAAKQSNSGRYVAEYLSCEIPKHFMQRDVLPPGVMGTLALNVYNTINEPFWKFAIPGALASVAGLAARKYKTSTGAGTTLVFIVVAQSAIGKTQVASGMQKLQDSLRKHQRLGERMQDFTVASRQGLHEKVTKIPSLLWTCDECAGMLKVISNGGKGGNDTAQNLQDIFNKLYDLSHAGGVLYPSASVASKDREEKKIRNPSVSTFWGTTPDNAKDAIAGDIMATGLGSRMIFIMHDTQGGIERAPKDMLQELPNDASQKNLLKLMASADELDNAYIQLRAYEEGLEGGPNNEPDSANAPLDPNSLLINVQMSTQAEELMAMLRRRSGTVKRSVHKGKDGLPGNYLIFARVASNVERMACVMAALDNPNDPVASFEHVAWSLGYLLQTISDTVHEIDSGSYMSSISDGWKAFMSVLKAMSKTDAEQYGVGVGDLHRKLRDRAPFAGNRGIATKMIKEVVDELSSEGAIAVVTIPQEETERNGRKGSFYQMKPDHKLWKQ